MREVEEGQKIKHLPSSLTIALLVFVSGCAIDRVSTVEELRQKSINDLLQECENLRGELLGLKPETSSSSGLSQQDELVLEILALRSKKSFWEQEWDLRVKRWKHLTDPKKLESLTTPQQFFEAIQIPPVRFNGRSFADVVAMLNLKIRKTYPKDKRITVVLDRSLSSVPVGGITYGTSL